MSIKITKLENVKDYEKSCNTCSNNAQSGKDFYSIRLESEMSASITQICSDCAYELHKALLEVTVPIFERKVNRRVNAELFYVRLVKITSENAEELSQDMGWDNLSALLEDTGALLNQFVGNYTVAMDAFIDGTHVVPEGTLIKVTFADIQHSRLELIEVEAIQDAQGVLWFAEEV